MIDGEQSTTPRSVGTVRLRPFEPRDAGLIEEAGIDSYIPQITTIPANCTPTEAQKFIERQLQHDESGRACSFAVADTSTDLALGQISLWLNEVASGRAAVSYWIVRSARGQHRAASALASLSEWAFQAHPLHRLTLFIEPWNAASRRTAERAGYVEEGLLRRWQLIGSEAKDALVFGRLRELDAK